MPSLWGSKRTDDEPAERDARAEDSDAQQADEHTRLLPNRLDSDRPYRLAPDDPAVSPYNLFSVRLMRFATVVLTIIASLWWVLQLVSVFVTPPGLHVRGSGFYSFSYASIALATLLFTLMFFGSPSRSVRILSIVMAVVLLADMIIILAVQKTRIEEGWVGVASVIWALLVSLWTLFADRTVKWGKAEEEERLTGRAETRRTVGEWTAVLISTIAMSVLTVAVVLITLNLILRALDAGLAPPGVQYWVDSDKYRIHVYCRGVKSDPTGLILPTVLLEGGEEPVERGLWQLADGALNNGSIARYCFADRPGYGWSDTAPSPLSASMAEDALSEALARAGENGPWILVSAGVGSIYSRIFSSRHGKEVAGMLMIDPLHEDLLHRIGDPGRGFVLWLRGIISPLGLDRLPGAIIQGRTSEDRIWNRSFRQSGTTIFAKLQENLVADSLTHREATNSRTIQYPDTPLVLISSSESLRRDREWEAKQRDLTLLTRNLKHWDIVGDAPHRVWETLEGRAVIEKRLKQLVFAPREPWPQ